jgi:hypothetical protein
VTNNLLSSEPKIIIDSKKYDWNHVFIIDNPVMYIVMIMILSKYKINENRVIVTYLRKGAFLTNSVFPVIDYNEFWFDKYITKLFRISLKGSRILNKVTKKKQNFILYTNQAHLALENILDSRYCEGHVYIEEGQISYWLTELFSFNSTTFFGRLKQYYLDKRFGKYKNFYRDDAHAFIGMLPDVFPLAPKEKRFILNNYDSLKKYYKPTLVGIKAIGLTCSERRLKPNQWEAMLKALVDKMPKGGVIKLHPSFYNDFTKIESMLKKITSGNIELCDNDVIIELEMLYESKILIGSLTSLSKYAEAFGSKFVYIDLY